jgi:glutaredoxin-related protein
MSALKSESRSERIVLLSIDKLKPHEKGLPMYLELLKRDILKDRVLKYPVIADEKTHVILDGMHRWLVLKNLGYLQIPALLIDSDQMQQVRIGRRRIHRYVGCLSANISSKKVLSAALGGRLMKPRTTRHFFPFTRPQLINYPLELLRRGPCRDVSSYLSDSSQDECVSAIVQWMEEISEELEFLKRRTTEVESEKAEFMNRTKNLDDYLHCRSSNPHSS